MILIAPGVLYRTVVILRGFMEPSKNNLNEEDFGKGAKFAGTPADMSADQARGEGSMAAVASSVWASSSTSCLPDNDRSRRTR